MKVYGLGIKTISLNNEVLDAYYPVISNKEIRTRKETNLIRTHKYIPTSKETVYLEIDTDEPIKTVEDAFLRLHILSNRIKKPNTINLDGIFSVLKTNAWTNYGPIPLENIENLRLKGVPITIQSIDKFPPLTNYITLKNARTVNACNIRLGAYVSSGTVVMASGFINYNAGTMGRAMVEGRISQGVTIGDGTDIGGGASIMGTLSGGGREVITIGKNCLIGANGGTGISLGNNCTIEAGLYITAGAKVEYNSKIVKAIELSKINNILFIRDSIQGTIKAITKKNITELNKNLH
jgi:2,3,4,5-tetrahydropyridine-2-carboxylate N-succinyltransferase